MGQNSINIGPVNSATFKVLNISNGDVHRIRVFKQYGCFRVEPSFSPQGGQASSKVLAITAPTADGVINLINSSATHRIIGRG